jgi:hypothetical protein
MRNAENRLELHQRSVFALPCRAHAAWRRYHLLLAACMSGANRPMRFQQGGCVPCSSKRCRQHVCRRPDNAAGSAAPPMDDASVVHHGFICTRISPAGYAALCTLIYRLPALYCVYCSSVIFVLAGTLKTIASFFSSGIVTGPFAPGAPV